MKDKITARIIEVFSSNKACVASINGVWGCGKTYYWNNDISNKLKLKSIIPVYVSLFGKESLKEIMSEISIQILKSNFEKTTQISKKIKNLLSKTKNVVDNLRLPFGLKIENLLSFFEPSDFKNIAICFDDFERLSEKISYRDISGLISQLKEQKNCNIMLIQNSNAINKFDEKRIKEIHAYFEKIIDYEFYFNSSSEELIKTIDSKYLNMKSYLEMFMYEVPIRNLRTIQKLLNALTDFEFIKKEKIDEKNIENFALTLIQISYIYIEDKASSSKFDMFYTEDNYLGKLTDEEYEKIEQERRKWHDSIAPKKMRRFLMGYDASEKIIKQYLSSGVVDNEATVKYFQNISKEQYYNDLYDNFNKLHNRHSFDLKYTINSYVADIDNLIDNNTEKLKQKPQTLIFNTKILEDLDSQKRDFYHNRALNILEPYLTSLASDVDNRNFRLENLNLIFEFDSNLKKNYKAEKHKVLKAKHSDISKLIKVLKLTIFDNVWNSFNTETLNSLTIHEIVYYLRSNSDFTELAYKFLSNFKNIVGDHSFRPAVDVFIQAFEYIRDNGSNDEKFKMEKMLMVLAEPK
ncbi:MAG: hypothetical protein AB7F25_07960 [Deferribacterales bacterium]